MAPEAEVAEAVGPADADQDLADGGRVQVDEAQDRDVGQGSEDVDDVPMGVVRGLAAARVAVVQDAGRLPDETSGHSGRER